MKNSKIIFYINLGFVIFLAVGWFYFYTMIIMDDITRMPLAMTLNTAITGLNVIFVISLVLLPFTYRLRKQKSVIRK